MPDQYACIGGCGTAVKAPNQFAWGHKTNGCPSAAADLPSVRRRQAKPKAPKPTKALAVVEPVIEIDAPAPTAEVTLTLNEAQLERIWSMLAIEEKALAIESALLADRS